MEALRGGRQLLSPLPNIQEVINFLEEFEAQKNNPKFRVLKKDLLSPVKINLTEEESLHGLKVLRLQFGELLRIFDVDKQLIAYGKLEKSEPKAKLASVSIFQLEKHVSNGIHILIGQPDLKTIETCIEELSAIGVNSINFFQGERSQNKSNIADKNLNRLYKKRDSAIKQSYATYAPQINFYSSLEVALSDKCLSILKPISLVSPNDEQTDTLKEQKVNNLKGFSLSSYLPSLLILGPEGGFSLQELQSLLSHETSFLTLGKNVLRVETAAALGLAFLNCLTD